MSVIRLFSALALTSSSISAFFNSLTFQSCQCNIHTKTTRASSGRGWQIKEMSDTHFLLLNLTYGAQTHTLGISLRRGDSVGGSFTKGGLPLTQMVSHRQKIDAKDNSLYELYYKIKAYHLTKQHRYYKHIRLLQPILTIIGSSAILITFFIYTEHQQPKV